MANKSDFTNDEWSMLLASPMIASMAVTMTDPSGIMGMLQGGWAGARAMLNPKDDADARRLWMTWAPGQAEAATACTAFGMMACRI